MPKTTRNKDISMGMIQADIKVVESVLAQKENVTKYTKGLCAYHLQQASEKLIKLQIYASGVKIDYSKMYKHSILALIQYANTVGVTLVIPKYIIDNEQTITDWEALGRYDIHVVVRIDTIQKCLSVVNGWYDEMYKNGYR